MGGTESEANVVFSRKESRGGSSLVQVGHSDKDSSIFAAGLVSFDGFSVSEGVR